MLNILAKSDHEIDENLVLKQIQDAGYTVERKKR